MSIPETPPDAECSDRMQPKPGTDSDEHMGAVEGDLPTDCQQGNRNAPGLDDQGMPNDPDAIAEDVFGANLDESEGG